MVKRGKLEGIGALNQKKTCKLRKLELKLRIFGEEDNYLEIS